MSELFSNPFCVKTFYQSLLSSSYNVLLLSPPETTLCSLTLTHWHCSSYAFASGTHPSQSLITIAVWKCLSDIAATLKILKELREVIVRELSTYHS